jgi:hypothetical protein
MLHLAVLTSDAPVGYGEFYAIAPDLTFVIGPDLGQDHVVR